MNIAKLQDIKLTHRNPLHSYTLTMRKQRNLGNNSIHHCNEKNKTLRNKSTQKSKEGRKWQPTPVLLPGESQGWGSPVGCHLWGRTESDTTEAT